jgi:hypothetical protein
MQSPKQYTSDGMHEMTMKNGSNTIGPNALPLPLGISDLETLFASKFETFGTTVPVQRHPLQVFTS